MSIEMCKVNNLFTIERVSVYGQVDGWIDEQMECFGGGREQDVVWDGMVWGGWIGKGDVGWVMVLSLVGLGWG